MRRRFILVAVALAAFLGVSTPAHAAPLLQNGSTVTVNTLQQALHWDWGT